MRLLNDNGITNQSLSDLRALNVLTETLMQSQHISSNLMSDLTTHSLFVPAYSTLFVIPLPTVNYNLTSCINSTENCSSNKYYTSSNVYTGRDFSILLRNKTKPKENILNRY